MHYGVRGLIVFCAFLGSALTGLAKTQKTHRDFFSSSLYIENKITKKEQPVADERFCLKGEWTLETVPRVGPTLSEQVVGGKYSPVFKKNFSKKERELIQTALKKNDEFKSIWKWHEWPTPIEPRTTDIPQMKSLSADLTLHLLLRLIRPLHGVNFLDLKESMQEVHQKLTYPNCLVAGPDSQTISNIKLLPSRSDNAQSYVYFYLLEKYGGESPGEIKKEHVVSFDKKGGVTNLVVFSGPKQDLGSIDLVVFKRSNDQHIDAITFKNTYIDPSEVCTTSIYFETIDLVSRK